MGIDIKFVPLSFINSEEEILKQIKNTVVFFSLFQQYKGTSLNHYLESTQYGYTASAVIEGTHKLLRITDINSGCVEWDTVPFCNCDSERKYLLQDDDILIARTGGTTGKSFVVSNAPNNAVFASYLIRLRIKQHVNIDFISAFLNSYAFWGQIIEMKSGTGIPNVNAEKLKTLILPECDFQTQCDIANFLITGNNNTERFNELSLSIQHIESLYNDNNLLTAELSHQLTLVKKLRQQLLHDAVQGKLVPQDENDEPVSELLKRIKAEKAKGKKEKELPAIKAEEIPFEIPGNWVWCRLGELIELVSGQHIDVKDYNEDGIGLPYLTGPSDFGRTFPNPTRWTLKPKVCALKSDILITVKGAGVGKMNICNLEKVAISRQLMAVRVLLLCRDFIFFFLDDSFDLLQSEMKGTGIPGIGRENILLRIIGLPPINEQHRIVAKLDELMQTCDELAASIQASKEQNEQLLQQVLREALQEPTQVKIKKGVKGKSAVIA